MSKIFFGTLFFFLATSFSVQAAPTLNDYGALPSASMLVISPDGTRIAFRKMAGDKDTVSVISLTEKKQLSNIDVADIQPRHIQFLSNDLLYLSVSQYTRVKGFKGKFDTSTGYALDLTTHKLRQLLIPGDDRVYPGQSGLGRIVGLTPDGHYALMPAYVGTDEYVIGAKQKPAYGLLKVSLAEVKRHYLLTSGNLHSSDFFVNSAGELIAEERYEDKTDQHTIVAFAGDKATEIFNETVALRSKSFVGLSPDFKSLVFLETNGETSRTDYYLMDLTSGKISATEFGKADADVEEVITNTQRVVAGVRYSGFSPSYNFFDPALDKRVANILAQFPDQSVWISDYSPDWKHVVAYVVGSNYSGDYFLFSEHQKPRFLISAHPTIAPEDLNPIGKFTYSARDGLKIPTLLTIPKEKVTALKNLPAVIYPHGGPEAHDMIGFDYRAQALAAQGYLVIQPQYRGSSGFGRAHVLAGRGEWGKKMQDDLTDAIKALSEKGLIDPARVCIVGASYGGYAALAGGAFTPELYKCVVSINGIGDVNKMLAWDRSQNGRDSEVAHYMEQQFANGESEFKALAAMSPQKFAANFVAPVLLIHAEDDKRVPYSQSSVMAKALKFARKPVTLIELEGDNHHLLENKTRQQALAETVKFVNQHLK